MKIPTTLTRRIAAFSLIVVASSTTITLETMDSQQLQLVSQLQEASDTNSDAPQEASLFQSQGLLVETIGGQILQSRNSDLSYNPASGTKILTAFAVLQSLGPQYRFKTRVEYQGDIKNKTLTGTISFDNGNPFFEQEQLQQLANKLSQTGVTKAVAEIVTPVDFVFQNKTGKSATKALFQGLRKTDLTLRAPRKKQAQPIPSNTFAITVESKPILAIVKDCLSRSDNLIAERLGQLVGGAAMVSQIATALSALPANSISLQSSSGLGINRITPRAMMAVLTHFKDFLESHNLELSEALPVAGIDRGTIYRRFANSKIKGVMTGKTGTLKETDFGASVLVGELSTKNQGRVRFVIFQKGGNTAQLRQQQNKILENMLASSGGPGGRYK
ncbi:hypothetical protein BH11CYA1_BH11CYA1_33590 [soil metagenome]